MGKFKSLQKKIMSQDILKRKVFRIVEVGKDLIPTKMEIVFKEALRVGDVFLEEDEDKFIDDYITLYLKTPQYPELLIEGWYKEDSKKYFPVGIVKTIEVAVKCFNIVPTFVIKDVDGRVIDHKNYLHSDLVKKETFYLSDITDIEHPEILDDEDEGEDIEEENDDRGES
jgi:hypothetical protein